MAQRHREGVFGPGRQRQTRRQRFGRGGTVDAVPVKDHRNRQVVSEHDFQLVSAPEAQAGLWW